MVTEHLLYMLQKTSYYIKYTKYTTFLQNLPHYLSPKGVEMQVDEQNNFI